MKADKKSAGRVLKLIIIIGFIMAVIPAFSLFNQRLYRMELLIDNLDDAAFIAEDDVLDVVIFITAKMKNLFDEAVYLSYEFYMQNYYFDETIHRVYKFYIQNYYNDEIGLLLISRDKKDSINKYKIIKQKEKIDDSAVELKGIIIDDKKTAVNIVPIKYNIFVNDEWEMYVDDLEFELFAYEANIINETDEIDEADETREVDLSQLPDRKRYANGNMVLIIPVLGITEPVMDGTMLKKLKKAPGLYEDSPLPWDDTSNVLIAGHRTTYTKPFRYLNKLKKGDEINIKCNGISFIYEVEKVFVTGEYNWSITKSRGYSTLTLTTCHPLGSRTKRLVARAKLVNIIEE